MKLRFSLMVMVISIAAHAQDSTYKEMVGKYKFPGGSVIEEAIVTWENNTLTMASSAGTSVLEKMKGDTFNIVSFNGICVFKRDDAKKINAVHVDASGYVLDGTKDAAKLDEFSDAATTEKLQKTKAIMEESIRYDNRSHRKPFLALVYN